MLPFITCYHVYSICICVLQGVGGEGVCVDRYCYRQRERERDACMIVVQYTLTVMVTAVCVCAEIPSEPGLER